MERKRYALPLHFDSGMKWRVVEMNTEKTKVKTVFRFKPNAHHFRLIQIKKVVGKN
jgi:hypothetical protein